MRRILRMHRKGPSLSLNNVEENKAVDEDKSYRLSASGTFSEDDVAINKYGLRVTQGSPSKRPEAESAEYSLDDLESLSVLGQGVSGVVSRVRHRPTNKQMALKVIALEVNDETRRSLLTELRTLYSSSSDYIVKLHQAFFAEGSIRILLEYMDGGSLADAVKESGKFSEKVVAYIALRVLRGLDYLHRECNTIHRDIKPSNILLNREGSVKITDFGVSGQLAGSMSQCFSWVGTVTYMSPERISGESYGPNSDIWSLGLTLYELLEGSFAYKQSLAEEAKENSVGFWDLLDVIVEQPSPRPPAGCSAACKAFVSRCLTKDPANRPTAAALLADPFLRDAEKKSNKESALKVLQKVAQQVRKKKEAEKQ